MKGGYWKRAASFYLSDAFQLENEKVYQKKKHSTLPRFEPSYFDVVLLPYLYATDP